MKRPRPSIEIVLLAASSFAVNGGVGELCALIGVEYLRFSMPLQRLLQRVDAQKRVSIVFDSRQASTARLAQSMIATR